MRLPFGKSIAPVLCILSMCLFFAPVKEASARIQWLYCPRDIGDDRGFSFNKPGHPKLLSFHIVDQDLVWCTVHPKRPKWIGYVEAERLGEISVTEQKKKISVNIALKSIGDGPKRSKMRFTKPTLTFSKPCSKPKGPTCDDVKKSIEEHFTYRLKYEVPSMNFLLLWLRAQLRESTGKIDANFFTESPSAAAKPVLDAFQAKSVQFLKTLEPSSLTQNDFPTDWAKAVGIEDLAPKDLAFVSKSLLTDSHVALWNISTPQATQDNLALFIFELTSGPNAPARWKEQLPALTKALPHVFMNTTKSHEVTNYDIYETVQIINKILDKLEKN